MDRIRNTKIRRTVNMIEVAKKVGANTPMVWPKKKSRVCWKESSRYEIVRGRPRMKCMDSVKQDLKKKIVT